MLICDEPIVIEAQSQVEIEIPHTPCILNKRRLRAAGRAAGEMKVLRNIAIEDTHGSQAVRRDVIRKMLMNGGKPTLGPALQLMFSIMGRNAARDVGLMKPPVLTGLN